MTEEEDMVAQKPTLGAIRMDAGTPIWNLVSSALGRFKSKKRGSSGVVWVLKVYKDL